MSETKWGVWCEEWNSFVTAQAFDTPTGAYVHQKKLEAVTEGLQYDVREMSGPEALPAFGSSPQPRTPDPYDHRANELADRCGVLESELAECQRTIGALTRENERLRRKVGKR